MARRIGPPDESRGTAMDCSASFAGEIGRAKPWKPRDASRKRRGGFPISAGEGPIVTGRLTLLVPTKCGVGDGARGDCNDQGIRLG